MPAPVAASGSEHLLYGSDYCWTPAAGTAAQIAAIDSVQQPEGDTWRALTTRNARRLFRHLSDQAPDRQEGERGRCQASLMAVR